MKIPLISAICPFFPNGNQDVSMSIGVFFTLLFAGVFFLAGAVFNGKSEVKKILEYSKMGWALIGIAALDWIIGIFNLITILFLIFIGFVGFVIIKNVSFLSKLYWVKLPFFKKK